MTVALVNQIIEQRIKEALEERIMLPNMDDIPMFGGSAFLKASDEFLDNATNDNDSHAETGVANDGGDWTGEIQETSIRKRRRGNTVVASSDSKQPRNSQGEHPHVTEWFWQLVIINDTRTSF